MPAPVQAARMEDPASSLLQATPLHMAAAQGRDDIINLLLDAGAGVDEQDIDGDTPLFMAVMAPLQVCVWSG